MSTTFRSRFTDGKNMDAVCAGATFFSVTASDSFSSAIGKGSEKHCEAGAVRSRNILQALFFKFCPLYKLCYCHGSRNMITCVHREQDFLDSNRTILETIVEEESFQNDWNANVGENLARGALIMESLIQALAACRRIDGRLPHSIDRLVASRFIFRTYLTKNCQTFLVIIPFDECEYEFVLKHIVMIDVLDEIAA